MSEPDAQRPLTKPLGLRVGLAATLLLLEYLSLSLLFDAQTVRQRGGIWSLVGHAGAVGPLLVVGAASLLLAPRGRWGLGAAPRLRLRPGLLALHLLLAAAFFYLTSRLFGAPEAPDGWLAGWLASWLIAAVASPYCLLVGVLGDVGWVTRALSRALVVGGGLGALGFLGGMLSSSLWDSLAGATFQTVHALLSFSGLALEADPDARILALENFRIHVAPVCSGVEGLGLFLILILAFLFQFRKTLRFPQAWLLVPLGMAVIWLGNALRISALMVLGARVDPELAIGSFHSKAGWIAFCGITILLTVIARRSRFFTRLEAAPSIQGNPATPYLLPLLVWIAVGMVTSAFSAGHDPLYGLRVVVCGALLLSFRQAYRDLAARPSGLAWTVGIAVGIAWLLIPTSAERLTPGDAWSDGMYFSWLAFRTVGTVLVVPVCEELAFRGFLTRYLTNRNLLDVPYREMSWLSIGISSIAFGLLHGRIVLAIVTGVAYALLLKKSGRLIDPIVAHAASNAVIAAYVLATGSWEHF